MQAVWRGVVQFGLVTMPVRLYSATEDREFRFHQTHRADHGQIRHLRVCEVCGREVPRHDIVRGYELDDGRLVLLDDADFDRLPLPTMRAMSVLEFVPSGAVDPLHLQRRSYYVLPEQITERAYVLFREALLQTGQLAVGKIAIRQRETLAALRARPDVLVLHLMLWPDEIREPPQEARTLPDATQVEARELSMATNLIASMSGDFEADEFTDDTRRALDQIITAKTQAAPLPSPPTVPQATPVDLLDALERSVEQVRGQR